MTYFGALALFIGPPLVALALLTLYDCRRGRPLARTGLRSSPAIAVVLVHVAIALVYTTPWDNYLVATGVWWYNPALVTGVTLGWVPIEEYTFFVVQTLLSGLWLLALSRHVFPAPPVEPPRPALRRSSTLALGVVWLASVGVLLSGWDAGRYLGLILVWALPPIMLQFVFGADMLWRRRALIGTAILSTTAYLALMDALTIGSGTWTIDPAQSLPLLIGGVLPIEELIFFLLTNVLITFGVALMLAEEGPARLQALSRGRLGNAAALSRQSPLDKTRQDV